MKANLLFFCIVYLFPLLLLGQDSIAWELDIQQLDVSSNKNQLFATGNKKQPIDSTTLANTQFQNLGELLQEHTSFFVRSYGAGSLASVSARGGSASHTLLNWNGFTLNSVMLGQVDVTLVPVGLFNQVSIDFGGNSSLWGSGSGGATIHLGNTRAKQSGFRGDLMGRYGSFHSYEGLAGISYTDKKWGFNTRYLYQDNQNDFSYINKTKIDRPVERLPNAHFKSSHFVQNVNWQPSKAINLSAHFWWKNTHRELPPNTTQEFSSAQSKQYDDNIRTAVRANYIQDSWSIHFSNAYLNERIYYTDPLIDLASNSKAHAILQKAEFKKAFGRSQLLNVGVESSYQWAKTDNYRDVPSRWNKTFSSAYKIGLQKVMLEASFRIEHSNFGFSPLLPGLGFHFDLNNYWSIKSHLSRTFRLPTFNELFWKGAGATGNPDIKSESGWSHDWTFDYRQRFKGFYLSSQATIFSNYNKNQILWQQTISPSGGFIWTPKNVFEVWSKGLELEQSVGFKLGEMTFGFKTRYALTLANRVGQEDRHKGKLLAHTPVHKANASISGEWNGWRLSYTHLFVGQRFTTADNSRSMPLYHVGNIHLSRTIEIQNNRLNIFIKGENILNQSYEVLPNRPMPGLGLALGLKLQFNAK